MAGFYALILYFACLYLQPGIKFPALAPLKPILLTAGLAIVFTIVHVASRGRRPVVFEDQTKIVLTIFAFASVSTVFAYIKTDALEWWGEFVKTIIIVLVVVNIVDSIDKVRKLLFALVLIHIPVAIEGIRGFYTDTLDTKGTGRGLKGILSGFLGNSNDFALAVAVMLPVAYFMALATRSFVVKATLIGACILFSISIVATYSRGGFVTLAVIVAYIAFRSPSKGYAGVVIGGLLLALLVVAPAAYWSRMDTIGSGDENTVTRLWAWKAGFLMALHNPLLGLGPDNFPTGFGSLYRPAEATTSRWFTAHSVYFQVMGELGFIGFALFAWLVVSTYRAQRDLLRRLDTPEGRALPQLELFKAAGYALQASLLAFLVGAAFLSAAYYPHLWFNVALTQVVVAVARSAAPSRAAPVEHRFVPRLAPGIRAAR
jgi:probable O-glycosylation ligase (exosortase A-associated)